MVRCGDGFSESDPWIFGCLCAKNESMVDNKEQKSAGWNPRSTDGKEPRRCTDYFWPACWSSRVAKTSSGHLLDGRRSEWTIRCCRSASKNGWAVNTLLCRKRIPTWPPRPPRGRG